MSTLNGISRNVINHLFFLLLVTVCIFIISGIGNAAMLGNPYSKINYSSVNKSLKEFLDSINEQTSTIVHVTEEWYSVPVSLNLKNISIEEGLKRAFDQLGLSYALTFGPEQNIIQVHIPAQSPISGGARIAQLENSIATPPYLETAVPPEEGAPTPPTEADLSKMESPNDKNIDILDLSAVPPDADGQPGITERELLELKKSAIKSETDMSDVPDE